MNIKTYFLDYSFQDSFLVYSKKAVQGQLPPGIRLSKKIENNKQKVKNFIGANQVLIMRQTHSSLLVDADGNNTHYIDSEPEADGAVTSKAGLALAIQTADCAPVLLYCEKSNIIGAAHCGWRGSKNGLIPNIINMMKSKGAADIHAIIGPAIAQESYQVGIEFYKEFYSYDKNSRQFFTPDIKGKLKFDLPAMVEYELQKYGVYNIAKSHDNTFINTNYPSYRRDKSKNEQSYDRLLSCIIIKDS